MLIEKTDDLLWTNAVVVRQGRSTSPILPPLIATWMTTVYSPIFLNLRFFHAELVYCPELTPMLDIENENSLKTRVIKRKFSFAYKMIYI